MAAAHVPGRPLTGREFRHAALRGLPLRYVEAYTDGRPMLDHSLVPLATGDGEYEVGPTRFALDEFDDDAVLTFEWPTGFGGLYAVADVLYAPDSQPATDHEL